MKIITAWALVLTACNLPYPADVPDVDARPDVAPPPDADLRPDGPPNTALLALSPDSWSFPAINRGEAGSIKTFLLENRGGVISGPLLVTFTGADTDSFTILSGETDDCQGMLAGNSSCFIRVQFTPQGAGGVKNATLDVQASPGGHVMSTLTAQVDDCQPSTTRCVPSSNSIITCDPSGAIIKQQSCGSLSCDTASNQCWDVDPTNGLAAQLDMSSSAPTVTLTGTATIDTDAGTVKDGNGQMVSVPTATVGQGTSGPAIRVFRVDTLDAANINVKGSLPIAIVANGAVTLTGGFDASAGNAAGAVTGAGSLATTATCTGKVGVGNAGGGGAGRAFAGANGGDGSTGNANNDFGPMLDTSVGRPLVGGCEGGSAADSTRGHGGGAVQIVSRVSITFMGSGAIDVSGAGGRVPGVGSGGTGGGSGGMVLIESPAVILNGIGIAARGGGGSTGNGTGTTSAGGDGSLTSAGAGGIGGSAGGGAGGDCAWNPSAGTNTQVASRSGQSSAISAAGGGGGAVGYVRINTATGSVQLMGTMFVAASGSSGTVQKRLVP